MTWKQKLVDEVVSRLVVYVALFILVLLFKNLNTENYNAFMVLVAAALIGGGAKSIGSGMKAAAASKIEVAKIQNGGSYDNDSPPV